MTFRVFAYGSNMCIERIQARTPTARPVCAGCLPGHTLRFHKRGRDGSGKANALCTHDERDRVWGAIFDVNDDERPVLDRCESLGVGYDLVSVDIRVREVQTVRACVYIARPEVIDDRLRPFLWYKRLLLTGAQQHGLPDTYIQKIERVEAVRDPNGQESSF